MLSEPILYLYCDNKGCSNQEELSLTTTARGYGERNVPSQIESLGWVEIEDNIHLCPDCQQLDKVVVQNR